MSRRFVVLLFFVLVSAPGNVFAKGDDGEDLEMEMFFTEEETVTAARLDRYSELGGGVTPDGESYGGDFLRRMVTGYLEGSF